MAVAEDNTNMKDPELEPDTDPDKIQTTTDVGETKFVPPLYIQRYEMMSEILRKENVTSVVDFGCAECKFLKYPKEIPTVELVSGVDVDRQLLEFNQYCTRPLTSDYIQRREQPLKMRLMCGSVADCDKRLRGSDAITMIELIEHLEPVTLNALPHNVFGFIQPRIILVTTPNAEFNVLFPNFSGLRHWDHKFEWTRQEFQNWCNKLAEEYNYSVEFSGVGKPWESEFDHLGYCSQIAIFRRIGDCEMSAGDHGIEVYEMIAEYQHPYQENKLSVKQKVLLEVEYQLHLLTRHAYYYAYDNDGSTCSDKCNETDEERDQNNVTMEESDAFSSKNNCNSHTEIASKSENTYDCETVAFDEQQPRASSYESYTNVEVRKFLKNTKCIAEKLRIDKENSTMIVPIEELFEVRQLKNLCREKEILRNILLESGYTLDDQQTAVITSIPNDFEASDTDTESTHSTASVVSGQFEDAEDDCTCLPGCLGGGQVFTEESWD